MLACRFAMGHRRALGRDNQAAKRLIPADLKGSRAVPIANCLVRGELPEQSELEGLAALWSEESGIGPEHMTINVVAGMRQSGAACRVMALLYLPSLWEAEQVRDLQTGLARALGRGLDVALAEVQVITSIVEPGHVVEDGETQQW